MRLQDKTAVITGAGSGIGRAIAIAFAKEGARVIVAGIEPGPLEETRALLPANSGSFAQQCDVSQAAQTAALISAAQERLGRLDILVNNAGVVRFAPFHETTEVDWDFVLDTNLKSVFLLSRDAIRLMLQQGSGKIINVSSIAGLAGFGAIGPYCASKGGIDALTRALAIEYAGQKININCIAPGVIRTPMTKDLLTDESSRSNFAHETPYPRFGEPEDIASAAVYLAGDESNFVTGEILVVDGGWLAK